MPLPKSQVCIFIEVSGGNLSRHGDFSSFVQFLIQFANDPICRASGNIQDFGYVCGRQEFPFRGTAYRLMIRHSILLSGGTYRHPHDILIILLSAEDPF